MDSTQQLPLVLKPNKLKLVGSLLLSIFFTGGAIWMIQAIPFFGVIMTIFFGLCILVFGIQFLPGSAFLECTEDGFAVAYQFRKKEYNWSDIESFSIQKFAGSNIVTWTYVKAFQVQNSDRKFANRVMQTEASLPDTYGMSAEELTDLMNQLLQKYR